MMKPGIARSILIAAFFIAVSSGAAAAGSLEDTRSECQERLSRLDVDYREASRNANVLVIAGAIVAALGSALGGFLTESKMRRISAVVGALAAVLPVASKVLPDPVALRQEREAHAKHKDIGDKLWNQMETFANPRLKREYARYVIARYSDCRSEGVPSDPPAFPLLAENPVVAKEARDSDAGESAYMLRSEERASPAPR